MSLSDLMSSMDLTVWPLMALVLFGAAFVAILVRTFRSGSRAEQERAAGLPLDEAPAARDGSGTHRA